MPDEKGGDESVRPVEGEARERKGRERQVLISGERENRDTGESRETLKEGEDER